MAFAERPWRRRSSHAVHWLPFGYGATLFPRPISTAFLLGAFSCRAARRYSAAQAGRRPGSLVAAAFAGAVERERRAGAARGLDLGGEIAMRDRRRRSPGGFALGALLFVGLTDALTWGTPSRACSAYCQ